MSRENYHHFIEREIHCDSEAQVKPLYCVIHRHYTMNELVENVSIQCLFMSVKHKHQRNFTCQFEVKASKEISREDAQKAVDKALYEYFAPRIEEKTF